MNKKILSAKLVLRFYFIFLFIFIFFFFLRNCECEYVIIIMSTRTTKKLVYNMINDNQKLRGSITNLSDAKLSFILYTISNNKIETNNIFLNPAASCNIRLKFRIMDSAFTAGLRIFKNFVKDRLLGSTLCKKIKSSQT